MEGARILYKTMMLTWKYALPCFLVPFMFTQPGGLALFLLLAPGAIADVARIVLFLLALGSQRFLTRPVARTQAA